MSFETNITWDQANWTRPQKRTASEIVTTSVALARDGLDDMGMVSIVPYKTARICQAVRNYDAGGEAESAVKFDVNFSVLDIRRNKMHRVADRIPGIVFHELVHCLRFEHFSQWALAEKAVTEGLAYVLGDRFEGQLLRPDEYIDLESMFEDTQASYSGALRLAGLLHDSEAAYEDYDSLNLDFINAWDGVTDGYFSPLERIGITAVRINLSLGITPAELLIAEPAQILEVLDQVA